MSLIKPFRGLRPLPDCAGDVAAPPYDVLSTEEARQSAAGKTWSFLHISKPEIDLAPGTDPHAPEVYAKAAENMRSLLDAGIMTRDAADCYYAYRLSMPTSAGMHVQTGLVVVASVAAYNQNRIRKHEFTRPDKEDDRVRQIDALNAQTGPVLLAYHSDPVVDSLLDQTHRGQAEADVTAADGIRHQIWVLRQSTHGALIARITAAFDAMPALYIADGHHRSAAAARVAAARHPASNGRDLPSDYFLAVVFPHREMRILDYNRVVTDLNGLEKSALVTRLATAFSVETANDRVQPQRPGEFGMYLAGQWYKLVIKPELVPIDPVARLDVSLLSDHLLGPLLGITDLRRDKRIDFVGGIRGLAELERRVDFGEMAVAFSLHATSLEDLMAVADTGNVMPPKSTWFEPKLADGLVSHILD